MEDQTDNFTMGGKQSTEEESREKGSRDQRQFSETLLHDPLPPTRPQSLITHSAVTSSAGKGIPVLTSVTEFNY